MFDPDQRNIFIYNDGERTVHADPLVISDAIDAAFEGDDFYALCRDSSPDLAEIDPAAIPALTRSVTNPSRRKLVEGARVVFDLKPLDADGNGLTQEETLDILDAYLTFQTREKKGDENSPSSSTPSDGPPDSPSTMPLTAEWRGTSSTSEA